MSVTPKTHVIFNENYRKIVCGDCTRIVDKRKCGRGEIDNSRHLPVPKNDQDKSGFNYNL